MGVGDDVTALANEMRDILRHINRCRDGLPIPAGSESCLREVIRAIMEGASLIEAWNHASLISRYYTYHPNGSH